MYGLRTSSATYRMLLARVALTTARRLPFALAAPEALSGSLKYSTFVPVKKNCEYDAAGEDELFQTFPRQISSEELDFIGRFPTYDFWSDEKWGEALGTFAAWALEDLKK